MKKEIFVTEEASGDRVDKFLSEQCEEYSRSFLQKLMKSGGVFADGRPVKASYRVWDGDRLSFEVREAVEPEMVAVIPRTGKKCASTTRTASLR